MMKSLRGWLATDISIDLGTAYTLIYVCGQGVVLNEPSVVAIRYHEDNKNFDVVAVGDDAKRMRGRTPENMKTIRPLKDGIITDFEMTKQMIQHFIDKVYKTAWMRPRPRIVVCVPCEATETDRRMIKEAVMATQAKAVYLIEEPVAAAIGAGLPIYQPTGSMVVDIGGGTTEIAVMSLSGVVASRSLKVGGDKLDESIIHYVERNFGCLIGEVAAEQIKIEIGQALPSETIEEIPVRGRHLTHGIPVSFTINSNEIIEAVQPILKEIVRGIHAVLQELPPDLAADIVDNGITLTGGGALIRNLDSYIESSLGIVAKVADEPLTCVARGGGMVLEKSKQTVKSKRIERETAEA